MMRHEWRVLQREKTVWFVVATLALTIGYAFWHGSQVVGGQTESIERFAQQQEQFLADAKRKAETMERRVADGVKIETLPEMERADFNFGARQSSWIGTRAAFVALAPAPLARLAVGQTDVSPPAIIVSSANYGGGVAGVSTENPLKLLAGHFDLARVVIYLFPLFILGLSFNLLSGEKESDTLRLVLAQPIRLRDLLAAKIIVRALIIFFAMILFSVIGFALSGVDLGAEGIAAKLLLWILTMILYGVFWFALAVLVNGFGCNSGTNALILIVCWLVFVVVIPALVNFAVAAAFPLPPQTEFVSVSRLTREEVNKLSDEEARKIFFANHPEFLPEEKYAGNGDYYVTAHARIDETDRRLQPLKEQFNRQFARRQMAGIVGGFFSPTILTQDVLFKIAGTEPDRYHKFQRQAEDFKQTRYAFFRPKMFEISKFADANFASANYDRIPRFVFRDERLVETVKRTTVPLVALLGLSLVLGYLGIYAYRRNLAVF